MKILIADDDPQILRALRITLKAQGYEVIAVADGRDALKAVVDHSPGMLMLDLGMPQLNGIEVIQAVRGWSEVPILVVSGRAGSADKVAALDAGADDYVTKPFSISELLARIRALTRRGMPEPASPSVRLGDTVIDIAAHSAYHETEADRRQIRLTPTEWKFLELLVINAGKLVTRKTVLSSIWGTDHVQDTGYLRLYMSQLRKKLEPDPAHPRYLLTEAGMGYRLELGG